MGLCAVLAPGLHRRSQAIREVIHMDADRFDTLTRSLAEPRSRRSALSGLLVGSVSLLGWQAGNDADAHDLLPTCKKKSGKQKKKCIKKAKAHTAQHASELGPTCTPQCAGKTCGANGCGGECGRCNGSCVDNACICPDPSHLCDGFCQQCCLDSHCSGGKTCQGGSCKCPSGTRFCNNTQCQECCSNLDCCGELQCSGGAKSCVNGTCACKADQTLIAGRCASPCDDACTASCAQCGPTFDSDTNPFICLQHKSCEELVTPCLNHGHCLANELCMKGLLCQPIAGTTNRCWPLCDKR